MPQVRLFEEGVLRAVGRMHRLACLASFVEVDPLLFHVGAKLEVEWVAPRGRPGGAGRISAVVERRTPHGIELDFFDLSLAAFRSVREYLAIDPARDMSDGGPSRGTGLCG